jgi:putative SOS response-associated peptidase YedK
MCNLYSLTKGQSAIRDLFAAKHDRSGYLAIFPSIYPDQLAPIVRSGNDGERELRRRAGRRTGHGLSAV